MKDTQNKPDGIVYVLSNRGFLLPEREDDTEVLPMVKIGYTKPATAERLRQRMGELFSPGVPVPFDLEYAKAVENCVDVEANMHKVFKDSRVNPKREFFFVGVASVKAALHPYLGKEITLNEEITDNVTESDIAARDRLPSIPTKTRPLSFDYMEILPGAELTSVADPSITAKVINDTEIEYNGEPMTPAAAATKIYREIRGTDYYQNAFSTWKYKGEPLLKIWRQMDAKHGNS